MKAIARACFMVAITTLVIGKQGFPQKEPSNQGKEANEDSSDIIYCPVVKEPHFPGGRESLAVYVREKINYPAEAKNKGTEGTVYVAFTINEKGKVVDPEIKSGVSKALDKEALRVVSNMPTWQPAIRGSDSVSTRFGLPIHYTFDKDSTSDEDQQKHSRSLEDSSGKDKLPKYPGGLEALFEYLKTHSEVDKKQLDPYQLPNFQVTVRFTIAESGAVKNPRITEGGYKALNRQLLKAFQEMKNWKPALENGQKVKAQYKLAVPIKPQNW